MLNKFIAADVACLNAEVTTSVGSITPEDIKRSLMLEIFLFTNRNVEQDIIDFKNKLFQEMPPFQGEEEQEDDDEDEEEIDEFCESKCECAMCKCLNNIYQRWEKFTPNSPMENILKNRIDEM